MHKLESVINFGGLVDWSMDRAKGQRPLLESPEAKPSKEKLKSIIPLKHTNSTFDMLEEQRPSLVRQQVMNEKPLERIRQIVYLVTDSLINHY